MRVLHVSHYLIGLSILIKGYAKLEHTHGRLSEVIPIFLAGLFIILGAAFHHRLAKRIKNFTATFHVAEGIALLFIGMIFLREGGSQLQYFYFFIGVVYLVIGFLFFSAAKENQERLQFQIRLGLGIVFILAGLLGFILNMIYTQSGWAIAVSLLIAAVGVVLIFWTAKKRKSRLIRMSE